MSHYVVASRTGPVITRTMSPWSTGGPEHARTYDNRRNVCENCTTIYWWVTRSVREKLRPLWTPSCKPFKNLVGSPRQCTRYGDMLREHPAWGDIFRLFYDMWWVLNSPHVVAKLVTVWQGTQVHVYNIHWHYGMKTNIMTSTSALWLLRYALQRSCSACGNNRVHDLFIAFNSLLQLCIKKLCFCSFFRCFRSSNSAASWQNQQNDMCAQSDYSLRSALNG